MTLQKVSWLENLASYWRLRLITSLPSPDVHHNTEQDTIHRVMTTISTWGSMHTEGLKHSKIPGTLLVISQEGWVQGIIHCTCQIRISAIVIFTKELISYSWVLVLDRLLWTFKAWYTGNTSQWWLLTISLGLREYHILFLPFEVFRLVLNSQASVFMCHHC